MKPLALYKFRPLSDDSVFCRTRHILERGEFWFDYIWNQNDPMEGVYDFSWLPEHESDQAVASLYSDKTKLGICCFSSKKALLRPELWGYYAAGFRGVAIGIHVDETSPPKGVRLVKMNYADSVPDVTRHLLSRKRRTPDLAVEILSYKLPCWKKESEYRFITDSGRGNKSLPALSEVLFGLPYYGIANSQAISDDHGSASDYFSRALSLFDLASEKQYAIRGAYVANKKVAFVQDPEKIRDFLTKHSRTRNAR